MASRSLKENTARGLFWGSVSNLLQQLMALVIGICLARQLAPGDYGMVAMLTVFSLLASNLQESGFTSALAVRREVTHRDYNAVFWFSIGVSLCMYLLLFLAAPLIAAYNRTPQLTTLARVSFLGFVCSALGTAHAAYLFRHLMVKQRMVASFVAVCVSGAASVALVYSGFAYWGLVAQDLVYKLVVMAMYWRMSPWRPTWEFRFEPIRRMFGFSSKILATNLLTTLNNQFLQAQLGHYYPRHDVGLYSQANKWNTMGYSLVGSTLAGVAQPVLAQAGTEAGRQVRVFRKMLRFTAFLSFPALFGLLLIVPEFVPLALKEQWIPCVPYLQVLCVGGAFIPLSQLYSNLLVSRGRSGRYLCGTAAMMGVQLGFILGLHCVGFGLDVLFRLLVALQIGWVLVWHALVRRELPLRLFHTLKDILPFALVAAAVMGLTAYVVQPVAGLWLRLLLKVVLAAALYAAAMYALRVVVFRECVEFLLTHVLHRPGHSSVRP